MRTRESAPASIADFCTILIQAGSGYGDNSAQWAYYTTNTTLCDNYISVTQQFCDMDPWFVEQFSNTCVQTGMDKFWDFWWVVIQGVWWVSVACFLIGIVYAISVPLIGLIAWAYTAWKEKRQKTKQPATVQRRNTDLTLREVVTEPTPNPTHVIGDDDSSDGQSTIAA